MISKKRLTKLLNPEFRISILNKISEKRRIETKMRQYAQYVVDSMIVNRDQSKENDKNYGYGFSPVQFICAVMKDGTIEKRFFEFNIINHFLIKKDGISAREVVECILIEWLSEDKSIKNFDMNIIDDELAKIEAEYLQAENIKQQKFEENINNE